THRSPLNRRPGVAASARCGQVADNSCADCRPFYGADAGGTRSGWHPPFVERIRRAEYPQYVWDKLPITGATESILRLDHVFALGADPAGYYHYPFQLSP